MIQCQHMEYVTYDEFKKMDIRIGTIRHIDEIEGADKLLKFLIQFTEELKTEDFEMPDGTIVPVRQILSGIREYYPDYRIDWKAGFVHCEFGTANDSRF